MPNEPTASRTGMDNEERGLAESPRDPAADQVRPGHGPTDRAGTEAEAGMSNKPIPIPNEDPEVGLTTPVED